MKKEIAIIGMGRFGRVLARELRRDFRICASDPKRFSLPGVAKVSLREAAGRRVIVLALPAGKLRRVLDQIAPHVAPGTLIMDVCAVKEEPARWMRELLPRFVDIVGLHPLFGPDSARRGMRGQTVVVCPVRAGRERLSSLTRYLRSKGLVVRRATPGAHDREMARTLFVTQFLGRALAPIVPDRTPLATPNTLRLQAIIRSSVNDAPELFRDLYRYNRFARQVAPSVLRRTRRLLARLVLSK